MKSGPRLTTRLASLSALLFLGCVTVPTDTPVGEPEPAAVQPENQLLFRNAAVLTGTGEFFERADVLIGDDRIFAVGLDLDRPAGARTIDASGRWITPGLIDTHSHIGVYAVPRVPAHSDGNEATSPFTPHVRAADSFWPQDPALRSAAAGGVTTVHVLPGSANLVGGQGVTLSVRPGLSASELEFLGAPVSMKMACGENPKAVYGQGKKSAPATRMAEVAMLRQKLAEAQVYRAASGKAPDYKKLELQKVVTGEYQIQNHCYRADEMLIRLDLFAEFGIKPRAFHHAVEAYKIRAQLAEQEVGVATWVDWWGRKLEMLDAIPAGVALLHQAGVRVAVHSDSPDDVQRLNQEVAKGVAAGRRAGIEVSPGEAIRWVTANAAWILGIEAETGTLEVGKRADLVLWSGDPLSVYTRADRVYNAGVLTHDRSDPNLFPASDFELGREVSP